jgi:branched-chain amino acid aminotransferase
MSANEPVVYINGEYTLRSEAKISVFDRGFLYGDCVYDTTSAWAGYIFKLDEHIERFYRSIQAIGINMTLTREEMKEVVIETTRRSDLREAYIQLVATRGTGENYRDYKSCTPTVIVYAIPYVWIASPAIQQKGIKVKISSTRRTPHQCLDPRIKNFNWLNILMAKLESDSAGMDNAIMLDMNGNVSEGPGFNVFLVSGETLFTPKDGMLMGITRETVCEISEKEGIDNRADDLTPFDLYTADEVFFSSTAGGVMPVVEVDGRIIGDGVPGPITTRIKDRYWEMRENGEHGTPVFD